MSRPVLCLLVLCCAVGMCFPQSQTPLATSAPSAAPSPTPLAYGTKLHIPGIPNAGRITDQLYRGAQPHPGSIRRLQELGITTIVDLRGEDAAVRERERREALALGIQFVSIPVSGWSAPTSDQVSRFLALFAGHPQEKVFVHCHFGEDRTGVFVATYRMAFDKWQAQPALQEMDFFGFNGFWHPNMASYVRRFPGLLASPAFTMLINPKTDVKADLATPGGAASQTAH